MIKKLCLTGALALAISGVANANIGDGFYAGLGIGAEGFFDRQNASIPSLGLSESSNLGNIGFIGGGFLGYNFAFPDRFNLGMEIFLNGTTAKSSLNTSYSTAQDKIRYNYGFRILPGYKWNCDTVSYVILGVTGGAFNTSYTNSFTGNSGSNNFNRTGFQVGVGSATNIWCNKLFLRADIIYTGYGTRNTGNSFVSASDKLSTLDGMVSLVYKFT